MSAGVLSWLTGLTGSRYAGLLIVMLALIVIYPLVGAHPAVEWVLSLAWIGMVATALRAIASHTQIFRVSMVLGVVAFGLSALAQTATIAWVFPYGAALRTAFYGLVIGTVLRDILRRTRIDLDAVFGACCAYLLLGIAFTSTYALIEWIFPGSFSFPPESAAVVERFGPETTEAKLLYFSLITMTTVGYGDITPASPPARALASIEGVLAQLYIAVLVARMVAMELTHRGRDRS